ncbi:hypothetical protein [Pseudoramibacter alactolyticus]|jgi:hypothetical protein|uniref:hypothetical protein n=1 Tax=Pseudoramibacter alactolyticus TaxID=113287 RepID=UPI0028E54BF9|nr:hypothetical protein [Pseudoramibacter alactolyticus]
MADQQNATALQEQAVKELAALGLDRLGYAKDRRAAANILFQKLQSEDGGQPELPTMDMLVQQNWIMIRQLDRIEQMLYQLAGLKEN